MSNPEILTLRYGPFIDPKAEPPFAPVPDDDRGVNRRPFRAGPQRQLHFSRYRSILTRDNVRALRLVILLVSKAFDRNFDLRGRKAGFGKRIQLTRRFI